MSTLFFFLWSGHPRDLHVLTPPFPPRTPSDSRSPNTPNARLDQYLRGRDNAITAAEKRGYHLFKSLGCVSCHQGRNVGGNLFQKVGIFADYFASRGNIREIDFGR